MKSRTAQLLGAGAGAVVASLGVFSLAATSVADDADSVFYACAKDGSLIPGSLSVDSPPTCNGGAVLLEWGQQGPAGPPGTPGVGSEAATVAYIADLDPFGRGSCNDVWAYQTGGCDQDLVTAAAFGYRFDAGDYPASATFVIESVFRSAEPLPYDTCLRLVDAATGTPVSGSEKCVTVPAGSTAVAFADFESDPFVLLPGDARYAMQSRTVGFDSGFGPEGPFGVSEVRLRVNWTP